MLGIVLAHTARLHELELPVLLLPLHRDTGPSAAPLAESVGALVAAPPLESAETVAGSPSFEQKKSVK